MDESATKFKKELSVFKDWEISSDTNVEQCLYHDFNLWKVSNFVKDREDMENIKEFIRENWSEIRELRMGAIADSGNPPQLTQ